MSWNRSNASNAKKPIFNVLPKIAVAMFLVVAVYLLVAPLLPAVKFEVEKAVGVVEPGLTAEKAWERAEESAPETNTLAIPVIGVRSKIIEGNSSKAFNKGVWHRPGTGNPVDGGNMVLTGHRFYYTGFARDTFYNLDKVKEGDGIVVFWNKESYEYEVRDIQVVNPTDIGVEQDFGDDRLTLYTCTPLWTAHKRLVVIAFPK